jgi:multisubunit Na+/H+ antiporter MnhB subunit
MSYEQRLSTYPQNQMKATRNISSTPLILKIVGAILILVTAIEYFILWFPPEFPEAKLAEQYWRLGLIPQMVSAGIFPLIGLAAIAIGYWMSDLLKTSNTSKPIWQDLRLWAFSLSTILGLIFLVIAPLHLSNVNSYYDRAFADINQKNQQYEQEITKRLQAANATLSQQLQAQIDRLDAAIKSGQVQGAQLSQLQAQRDSLQKLKANPQAAQQELQKEAQAKREELKQEKQKAEEKARKEQRSTVPSVFKTGLTSLLLAIAYAAIGWLGLRNLLASRRQTERW